MILFAMVLVASLVLAIAARRRPVVWLSVGLIVLIGLPRVVSRGLLAGADDFANFHPSTWVFLAGTVITLLTAPKPPELLASRKRLNTSLVLWAVLGVIIIFVVWGSAATFVAFYIAPMAAFAGVSVVAIRVDSRIVERLSIVVLWLAAAEATLALIQWGAGNVIFYEQWYSGNYWWRPTLSRSLGTLDSPLDLAAFLTMSLPLVARIRRTPVATVVAMLIMSGVLVTGSRVGIIAAVIVLVWVLITHSRNLVLGTLIGTLLAAGSIIFMASPLADELLSRFGERGDVSTGVREVALDIGLGFILQSPLAGHGNGFAYAYSSNQLDSSFENGYLSSAIDYGIVIIGSLVVLQVIATLAGPRSALLWRVPGLLAVFWGFAYSSFTSPSAFGVLVWLFIALSSVSGMGEVARSHRAVKADRGLHVTH